MFVPEIANFYPDLNEQYFHPTFLYEIIPNFFLLVWLLYDYEKLTLRRSGLVFARYAIGYGTIRFCTEFFRLDALKVSLPEDMIIRWQNLTIDSIYASQVASVILIIVGLVVLYTRRKTIYVKRTMSEYVV
jgi:prolipoprotein diacylglyceryltransferase